MNRKYFISLALLVMGLLCLSSCSPDLDKLAQDYKKVTSSYEEELLKNPQDLKARLELARFYYQFNDYDNVHRLLDGQTDDQSRTLLAQTLSKQKKYTQSLELFDQIGEQDDNEYMYLYAYTLEEKNLFPRAVKMYGKVKGEYEDKAKERIKAIGLTIEEEVPDEIKDLFVQHEYFILSNKEAEAAVLLVNEDIEIKENNTSISDLHVVQQVLKEKGKELGEVVIGYDSTDERIELEYARTITPQGKVVYAGKENIRDVSKYLNFPLYSNARAYIVSMPAVEVGSIIEYKVRIFSSKLINEDDFTFLYRLRELYPIAQAQFRVSVPAKTIPKFKVFNQNYAKGIDLMPKEETVDSRKIYTWKFRDIAPIIPEEEMPPSPFVNPASLISSFASWGEIYDWWNELFIDKLELTDKMKEFLNSLLEDAEDDLEKARRIYEFCAQEIRYVAVEYGESGHEPHHAKDVFLNRYGDCKDQATLLVALMRHAGLNAYPVLIPTRDVYPITKDFPSMNFNHAIAVLKYNGSFIFMDPTSATTSFGDLPIDDQDREVLIFLEDEQKLVKTDLFRNNEVIYNTVINIDSKENASVIRDVVAKGYFATYQRYFFQYTHPQKIKEYIQQAMAVISPFSYLQDYELINVEDFTKDPALKYNFIARKFLNPAQDLRVVPAVPDIVIDTAYTGKKKRKYPIEFLGIYREDSNVTIRLPKDLIVKYIPKEKTINTKWFEYKRISKYNNNTVTLKQTFDVKEQIVPVKDYKKFKSALEKVIYFLRERIILEKKR